MKSLHWPQALVFWFSLIGVRESDPSKVDRSNSQLEGLAIIFSSDPSVLTGSPCLRTSDWSSLALITQIWQVTSQSSRFFSSNCYLFNGTHSTSDSNRSFQLFDYAMLSYLISSRVHLSIHTCCFLGIIGIFSSTCIVKRFICKHQLHVMLKLQIIIYMSLLKSVA